MLFIILLILQTSFQQSCLIIITIFIRTNSTWFEKRLFLVWEDKQSFIMHKIYETLFSLTWRIVRFYTGHFRVLIPEKYESRIQLKESGIPLTIEIRNPSSTGKESEIQDLLIWTPEFRTMTGIQISDSLESSWKYLTLGEKKSDIHSLLKVHLDFGVVFGTDLIWISLPKEVIPVAFSEAPTASQSCAQISCPDLPLTYGEKCCRRSGYEINLPLSKAASARKTESTRAVHALSKYVGTCGQKRERGL